MSLEHNRTRLVAWQAERYARPKTDGVVRLNLGSGHLRLPGYVNVDAYTAEADVHSDIAAYLRQFANDAVAEISSHHALEHLPQRELEPMLREWFRVLAPGGELDLGMPDLELCVRNYLTGSREYALQTIYGSQEAPGMFHQAGIDAANLLERLKQIGFQIKDWFQYDGNGTPSVWVLAAKPVGASVSHISTLEMDVIAGTFTHQPERYLPKLLASAQQYLPHIPFVTRVHKGQINAGMELLRQDFIASGKRYWLFLDHDIQFLNAAIVRNAIANLVRHGWAGVTVYSTFDPHVLEQPYFTQGLTARGVAWLVGYFILVDSKLVGDIQPDQNLPDGNTSVDTTYSVEMRARGFRLGISPDKVYHVKKSGNAPSQSVIDATNAYHQKRWGDFYFQNTQYTGCVLDWGLG